MKSVPMSSKMKAVGRNMAKVDNQKSGSKVSMKFAKGGMAMMAPTMARGGGAATKGKKFEGSY